MSIRTTFVVAATLFCLLVCVQMAPAQRAKFRLNQDFRYLGGGQSAGYHHCSPGPNVDYYNPYSRHNSELRIGGAPQGAGNYWGAYNQNTIYGSTYPNHAWGGDFVAPAPRNAPGDLGYENNFDEDSAIETPTPKTPTTPEPSSALEPETSQTPINQPPINTSEPIPFPIPHADSSSGDGAFSVPGSNYLQRRSWAQPASSIRTLNRPIRGRGFRRGNG